MKLLQYIMSVFFVLAGIALLCAPSAHALAPDAAFTPTRFTVVDEGKAGGPDIILVPGLASSRSVWDAEAKLLAPSYHLHLVQIDGFAGQPAGPNANATMPILPNIVDQLHQYIASAHMHPAVIGHSMGGLLALMLADKYPQDVSKLVIVDALPFYGTVFGADATVDSIKPQAQAMLAQLGALPEDQYAALQPMLAAQMVNDPAGQKLVADNAAASDRHVVLAAMAEDLDTDLRPDVAHIAVPTLVLYAVDAHSLQADPGHYEAAVIASYKPMSKVTLVKVDNSRHFIMLDQPAKFDAAVEAFLK